MPHFGPSSIGSGAFSEVLEGPKLLPASHQAHVEGYAGAPWSGSVRFVQMPKLGPSKEVCEGPKLQVTDAPAFCAGSAPSLSGEKVPAADTTVKKASGGSRTSRGRSQVPNLGLSSIGSGAMFPVLEGSKLQVMDAGSGGLVFSPAGNAPSRGGEVLAAGTPLQKASGGSRTRCL